MTTAAATGTATATDTATATAAAAAATAAGVPADSAAAALAAAASLAAAAAPHDAMSCRMGMGCMASHCSHLFTVVVVVIIVVVVHGFAFQSSFHGCLLHCACAIIVTSRKEFGFHAFGARLLQSVLLAWMDTVKRVVDMSSCLSTPMCYVYYLY